MSEEPRSFQVLELDGFLHHPNNVNQLAGRRKREAASRVGTDGDGLKQCFAATSNEKRDERGVQRRFDPGDDAGGDLVQCGGVADLLADSAQESLRIQPASYTHLRAHETPE